MKAKRFIDVTAETRKELMKIFNCSTMNVWRALNFESDRQAAAFTERTKAEAQRQ